MDIPGAWVLNDDGITRPMLAVEVQDAHGTPIEEFFLIDSGADRTVFRADLIGRLNYHELPGARRELLQGLMGRGESLIIATTIAFKTKEGTTVRIAGDFTALTDPAAIDTSILGRDVLNNFDVILSRRSNEVLLLAGDHRYSISSS